MMAKPDAAITRPGGVEAASASGAGPIYCVSKLLILIDRNSAFILPIIHKFINTFNSYL
jgi:hypothetical protein